ncbi:hypothetical protein [Thermoactinospora rubra]|uniref:hypothetical protein n=1 Tax=Thermoactinospora rubra TaxID=1088767 RepID=UPI000A116E42|nr:hypothetical protein [Thermoactinospora rubra]
MRMSTRSRLFVGLASALALAGCAAPRADRPVAAGPPVILTGTSTGVVVADPASGSYRGYTATGRLVWTDRDAYARNADVVCTARCPEAVVSAPGPGRPRRLSEAAGTALPYTGRVLSVRGDSDAVVASARGLQVFRTDGKPLTITAPEAAWQEDPTRTVALALTGNGHLWFARDRHGWRAAGRTPAAPGSWGACLAERGALAVLVGPHPVLLVNRRPVPLRTDLKVVGECAAGRHGAAVVDRWMDGAGTRHTGVRGVAPDGRQTWSRDIAAEAEVAAHPSGRKFALVHGGALEVVDDLGRTVLRRPGVGSALFTETGTLIVATLDGRVAPVL